MPLCENKLHTKAQRHGLIRNNAKLIHYLAVSFLWVSIKFLTFIAENLLGMKITPVIKKRPLSVVREKTEDVDYWLKQPAADRIAAVTFIISQSLQKGQKMDKTFVVKRKMKV